MTGIAELADLKPILMQLFVFTRRIITVLANRAFQSYRLAHIDLNYV